MGDGANSSGAMKTCLQCSGNVEGTLEGIPLTICCRKCCTATTKNENGKRQLSTIEESGFCVSKTKASKICRNCSKKLKSLHFATVPNGKGNVMYLYIKKEVEMLAKRVEAKRTEERRNKEEEELRRLRQKAEQRELEVKEMMALNLKKTDPVLNAFMVKDYFTLRPKIKTEVVLDRLSIYDRAMEIRGACTGAHPDAVFDFCIEYPDGGPVEFQELKEKIRLVFRLEGARILYNLPKSTRESLKETPLADVYAEFEARDARAIVHSHLERMVGEERAAEMMSHAACQHRLAIGGFESTVAQKLYEFWEEKDDIEKRKRRLKRAFRRHKRPLMKGCKFYSHYIQGLIDCDVEEVMAVVAVYREMQVSHFRFLGLRVRIGRMEFCRHFYEEHRALETSINLAIDHARRCHLSKMPCSYHNCSLPDEDDAFIEQDDENSHSTERQSGSYFGQEYDNSDSMDDENDEDSDFSDHEGGGSFGCEDDENDSTNAEDDAANKATTDNHYSIFGRRYDYEDCMDEDDDIQAEEYDEERLEKSLFF